MSFQNDLVRVFKVDFDAFDNMATCPLQPKESIDPPVVVEGWRLTAQNGLYWGKSLFISFLTCLYFWLVNYYTLPTTILCDGLLSEMRQNSLGNASLFNLFLAPFIETWDGDSSTALKMGQDVSIQSFMKWCGFLFSLWWSESGWNSNGV